MLTVADINAQGILIIGVGNEFRGDDCAGLLVVRAVASSGVKGMRALELPGEGTELIEAWRGEAHVIIADASRSGADPGTITRLDAKLSALPQGFFIYSTHAFGLAEAVETSRNLNTLPAQLVIYAIEGQKFEYGTHVSPEVKKAAEEVTDSILTILRQD